MIIRCMCVYIYIHLYVGVCIYIYICISIYDLFICYFDIFIHISPYESAQDSQALHFLEMAAKENRASKDSAAKRNVVCGTLALWHFVAEVPLPLARTLHSRACKHAGLYRCVGVGVCVCVCVYVCMCAGTRALCAYAVRVCCARVL